MLENVGLTRRSLVAGGLAAGAWTAVRAGHACDALTCCTGAQSWSAAGYRDGSDVEITSGGVVLDRDARVGRLTIGPHAWLALDPVRSVRLVATGNVVVQGVLRMAPSSAVVDHALIFEGVQETDFRGGGMVPLDSDIGLWVTGAGRLELQGSPRTPWVRLAEPALAGGRSLVLLADPVGWMPGDEIAVVPTGAPTEDLAHDRYDTVRVLAVAGRVLTLDRGLAHAHPLVQVAPELRLGAEVLNLTRNVRVEGTAGGRSHVWITSSRRSVLEHFAVRHTGPRQADGPHTASVLGRYAVHLHMNRDASRGTKVVGAVVRDAGSHAYVPHLSHGVSFQGCISHDTMDEAYWYDPVDPGTGEVVEDLLYEGCVASRVTCDPVTRGFRLAGWTLGAGERLTARHNVAVGVQGNIDAAGFVWPEGDEGLWTFHDNVGHNNKVNGLFVWQNTSEVHVVSRFVGYHQGGSGVSHGAYLNAYRYEDCVLRGNGRSALLLHGLSTAAPGLSFVSSALDGAGLSEYAVEVVKHTLHGKGPVVLRDCSLRGYRTAGIGFTYEGQNGTGTPELLDVLDCSFSGNELYFADGLVRGAAVRFQRAGDLSLLVGGRSDSGTYFARWNGRYRTAVPVTRPLKGIRASPRLVAAGPIGPSTQLAACPSVGASAANHGH